MSVVDALDVDATRELYFDVEYDGCMEQLRIEVFMDDVDAPDLYFFAQPRFSEAITELMRNFCEEHGI